MIVIFGGLCASFSAASVAVALGEQRQDISVVRSGLQLIGKAIWDSRGTFTLVQGDDILSSLDGGEQESTVIGNKAKS